MSPTSRILHLLIFPTITFSQSLTVTMGPPVSYQDLEDRLELSKKEQGINGDPKEWFYDHKASKAYSLHDNGLAGDLFLAAWDNYLTLGEIKTLGVDFLNPGEKAKVSLLSFLSRDGKEYAIYRWKYEDRDEFSLYVSELSNEMKLTGSPILLSNYKNLEALGSRVTVSRTPDNNLILLTRVHTVAGNLQQSLECKAVTKGFSELWNRTITLNDVGKDVHVQTIKTDNEGNLHFLSEKLLTPGLMLSLEKKMRPALYSFFWKTRELKKFELGKDENSWGVNFVPDDNMIIVSGLHRDRREFSCFVNKIDIPSQSIEPASIVPLPKGFASLAEEDDFKIEVWGAVDIVPRQDHSWIVLVGARMLLSASSAIGSYHAAEDYLFSFSPQANLEWISKINRRQIVSQNCLGTYVLVSGDKVFAIYNDMTSNLSRPVDDDKKAITDYKKPWTITVLEIDKNGKARKYAFPTDVQLNDHMIAVADIHKVDSVTFVAQVQKVKRKWKDKYEARNVVFKIY